MQNTQQHIIEAIKSWIFDVVIGKNFCPFAKKEWLNDTISYRVCEAGSHKYITPAGATRVAQTRWRSWCRNEFDDRTRQLNLLL